MKPGVTIAPRTAVPTARSVPSAARAVPTKTTAASSKMRPLVPLEDALSLITKYRDNKFFSIPAPDTINEKVTEATVGLTYTVNFWIKLFEQDPVMYFRALTHLPYIDRNNHVLSITPLLKSVLEQLEQNPTYHDDFGLHPEIADYIRDTLAAVTAHKSAPDFTARFKETAPKATVPAGPKPTKTGTARTTRTKEIDMTVLTSIEPARLKTEKGKNSYTVAELRKIAGSLAIPAPTSLDKPGLVTAIRSVLESHQL